MKQLEGILKDIIKIAASTKEIDCIKLFGSRARGEHKERSDIDLAIFGENIDKEDFTYRLETEVLTLLEFDLSYMEEIEDNVFREQVEKEGMSIYEKPRF